MRILRSKGIGNISVFVDSNIFQGILGNIGNSRSRIYSINQIKSKGAFHPKVYMFFGEKKGLLIIGSGNLTSSGHGKNDEVWGAFHFDINDPKHTQLFANSWAYLKDISLNTKGFTKEKIRWIREYSPWIESLPSPSLSAFEKLDKHSEIAFLSNNSGASIFNQLSSLVPFKNVKELTIVAPYFDAKGKIIEMFRKALPNAEINVLVDEDNGILPFGLSDAVAKNVNFYHWNDCSEDKGEKSNARLHAKIFNFVMKDKSQYCLFGSANASVAALGGENISAINDEVSILMSSSKLDFLKELGVKVNSINRKLLSDFTQTMEEDDILFDSIIYKYNIDAIDKEGSGLNVYIDKKVESNTRLHLFDSWGEELYNNKLIAKNDHYSLKIPNHISNPVYGCLFDANTNKVLSNKQIIQDVILLSKTNPDPQKQVLDIIFSDIEQGDEYLFSKLIDCISVDDFKAESKNMPSKVRRKRANGDKIETEIKGRVLEYDDFKDVSYDALQQQYYVLNSTSNRIADFLSLLTFSKLKEEVASDEFDDEELGIVIGDTQGREDDPSVASITKSAFISERKRVVKFFDRYHDHLENEVDKLIEKSNENIGEEGEVSITELSNFVIALYIAIYYTDNKRQYTIDKETHHECILFSSSYAGTENLASINIELIGKFLLLCTRGFKTYDSEYLNERFNRLRSEALYNTIFCLAQTRWSNSEIHYKNNLLINALYFLPIEYKEMFSLKRFTEEMNIRQKLSANENLNLISEIKGQIDNILPKHSLFVENMNLPLGKRSTVLSQKLKLGQTIFTSRFGFCSIKYKTKQEDGAFLILSRPGFPWNDDEKDYLLEERRLFKRNIVY